MAHGLDLLSFLWALALFGILGESNGLMRSVHDQFGPLGIIALKSSGTTALALITVYRPWTFIPAAGSGLLGAAVNLAAISI